MRTIIKNLLIVLAVFCVAFFLTGCYEFWFGKPDQYHVCAQLSCENYLFSIGDIMFFKGYSAVRYDNYKRNGEEIEKIIINKEGKHLFRAQDRIDFYNNIFYVSDYKIEGKPNERKIILSAYNNEYALLKQIVTPIYRQNVYYSCFSKSGNYYYVDHKDKDNDLYDLYRFNIWDEENELLFENVEKYTRITDGDDIIIIDSYFEIKNLSCKDDDPLSYMINDMYYEIIPRGNLHRQQYVSICCEGKIKKEINFNCDGFNIQTKEINNNIFFCIQNINYDSKNCIHCEAGYHSICQLEASTIYKYDTAKDKLEVIRSFQPETFIIDFNDENIKYYYDGALYNNDDKICDFKLNYDKDNLTSYTVFQKEPDYYFYGDMSDENNEYWKLVGSKIKFLVVDDEIYYYDGLYNKYTVLEV